MSDPTTDVLAFLKSSGPSSPRAILDKIGGTPRALTALLRTMKAGNEVIAAGTTVNRVYGLPGQRLDLASATPKKRGRHAPAKKRRAARKTTRRAHRARKAPAPALIFAITANHEIVLFDGSPTPRVLTREQSAELADLAFAHFTQE